MNKRQEQKENTRKLIIDTAIGEFAQSSLLSAKTSDIAAAANVSHGTIFAHFPTRDALLSEAIDMFGKKTMQKMHQLISSDCSLSDLLHAHLLGIQEYELFYTRLISEAPLLDESARHTLVAIQSAISFHMSEIAQKEISEGKIKNMPFALMFNTWVGLINYYLLNKDLFSPNESVIERYRMQLVEHYINLITK